MIDITAQIQEEAVGLYEQHAGGLLRYARSITRRIEIANDAVQETFLRYLTERRFGRIIENPRTWLYSVMRNYLLRRLGDPEERTAPEAFEPDAIASSARNPEALALEAEAARSIATQLSPRELQCFHLRVEGLNYAEIAEVMRIRQGTVGALLARIHAKIRAAEEGEAPEATPEGSGAPAL